MTAEPDVDEDGGDDLSEQPATSRIVARRPLLVALLVVLIGAGMAVIGAGVVPLVCIAVVALLALVDTDSGYVAPHSFGLPGLADGAPQVVSVDTRTHLGTVLGGAAVLGGLSVVIEYTEVAIPSWSAIPVAAVVAVVTWLRAAPWIVGRRHAKRLRKALVAYEPSVAMGYAGRSGGPWQLKMWEPFIVRSGERTVVINVNAKYVPMIREGADLSSPLVQLGSRGVGELDDVLVPSLRAVFYVQNARTNRAFLAHDRLTHVWLNHGDSDKPANFNPRHALYDLLVVCGEAGVDRYARHGIEIPRDKFVVLGRPQSAGIKAAEGPIADLTRKVVLYAPTWQGLDASVNFSSLERGQAIVLGLIERGAEVMFRPHPLSYRWRNRRAHIHAIRTILKHDRETSERRHYWGKHVDKIWSVAGCANRSDALVSDVSSVVSDFLASGKPYAMTSMHGPVDEFRAQNPVAETGYVILGDMSNLDEALDGLLFDDPLAEERDQRRRYVLGDFTGEESAEAFADFVRTLAEGD